jgi:hypothetical protein
VTFYLSNPEVRPTGDEAGEFIDGPLLRGAEPSPPPSGPRPTEGDDPDLASG